MTPLYRRHVTNLPRQKADVPGESRTGLLSHKWKTSVVVCQQRRPTIEGALPESLSIPRRENLAAGRLERTARPRNLTTGRSIEASDSPSQWPDGPFLVKGTICPLGTRPSSRTQLKKPECDS